jgi:hypothetical protein
MPRSLSHGGYRHRSEAQLSAAEARLSAAEAKVRAAEAQRSAAVEATKNMLRVAPPAGIEPATNGLGKRSSGKAQPYGA